MSVLIVEAKDLPEKNVVLAGPFRSERSACIRANRMREKDIVVAHEPENRQSYEHWYVIKLLGERS